MSPFYPIQSRTDVFYTNYYLLMKASLNPWMHKKPSKIGKIPKKLYSMKSFFGQAIRSMLLLLDFV